MMCGVRIGLAIIAIGAFILGGYGIYAIDAPTIATIALVVMEGGLIIMVGTILSED